MATALNTWFERRVIGRFQSRLGPNRWGPFGLLQPLADIIKLATKEDTVPEDIRIHTQHIISTPPACSPRSAPVVRWAALTNQSFVRPSARVHKTGLQ
ncbi:MAG: NADH-quinone oxidoreductase subunit H [Chloroflexi bacterium]|nr:NADH-quinone oxidoreductase subunit H [Chloroflexota bacterium]